MKPEPPAPHACRTMAEVRLGVDRIDQAILALMGERFRYMDAAARIKAERKAVRDDARKAQVLANIERLAREHGVPEAGAVAVYERLIELSIAYELDRFDSLRA